MILSTTSGAGTGAVNGLAVYGAAKAGVNSLMRSIAIEYGRKGIRANAIAPSAASTGMINGWSRHRVGSKALPRHNQWGDWARAGGYRIGGGVLASEHASFVNGVVLPVDGGVEAMLAVPS